MQVSKILSREEVKAILLDLHTKGNWQEIALFRLLTCCGLRASEACGLKLFDIRAFGPSPEIHVRKEVAKLNKQRFIPLSWDVGTKNDLANWKKKAEKIVGPDGNVLHFHGMPISRQTVYQRWKKIITRNLGQDRSRQIGGPHSGRHTFCTHMLAAGKSQGEVRDAAGHSSIDTLNIYIHAIPGKTTTNIWETDYTPHRVYEDPDHREEVKYGI